MRAMPIMLELSHPVPSRAQQDPAALWSELGQSVHDT